MKHFFNYFVHDEELEPLYEVLKAENLVPPRMTGRPKMPSNSGTPLSRGPLSETRDERRRREVAEQQRRRRDQETELAQASPGKNTNPAPPDQLGPRELTDFLKKQGNTQQPVAQTEQASGGQSEL